MHSLAVFLLAALPFVRGEIKDVTVKNGETVKLPTDPSLKLQGDSEILWSVKSNGQKNYQPIIQYETGTLKLPHQEWPKEKVQLDETLGAITVGPLSVRDSSVFLGKITDINNKVHRFEYNVTVVEHNPNSVATVFPESIRTQPDDLRRHIFLALPFGLTLLVVVVVLVVKMKTQKKESFKEKETREDP